MDPFDTMNYKMDGEENVANQIVNSNWHIRENRWPLDYLEFLISFDDDKNKFSTYQVEIKMLPVHCNKPAFDSEETYQLIWNIFHDKQFREVLLMVSNKPFQDSNRQFY